MTRRLVLAARVSSVVLLGGIALASIALPFWNTFEERAGEVEERTGEVALRKLGASFSEAKSGGRIVELPTQISDDTLIKEGPHLEKLNIAHLLSSPFEIHELGAAERTDKSQLARSERRYRHHELGAAERADKSQ